MQARVGALRVVGVLAQPARRVVPGVVGQREALRARVQQQLARRRIGVVGDLEHGAGADVDVAVDEHASKHRPAGRLRQTSISAGGHEEIRSRPAGRSARSVPGPHGWGQTRTVGVRPARCGSDPGCAASGRGGPAGRGSMLARLRSLRTRGRRGSSGPGRRGSRVGAGLCERSRRRAMLARPAAVRAACETRTRPGRRGRRARRPALPPPLPLEERRARCGSRVHRAAAQVVVAAGDQDDRAGRVQLQAGGGLGRRGRERVADDLAAVDDPEALAAQRQAPPARRARCAMASGERAGEQRAGAGEQA